MTGWVAEAMEVVKLVRGVMEKRWRKVWDLDAKVLPLSELVNLDFDKDTALKLPSFRKHLAWIKSGSAGAADPMGPGDITRFNPLPHCKLPSLDDVPFDATMDRSELLEFEAWVEFALPAWLDLQLCIPVDVGTCESVFRLQTLIRKYRIRAIKTYDGTPEALSVMYLVLMELWVAMDKIAGNAIPLLLDYDPGFPPDMLHLLLLQQKEDMERLQIVEEYLSRRRALAWGKYSSAFGGFGGKNSFAVRFYKTSAQHQKLKSDILTKAAEQKAEKLQEYEKERERHQALA